MQNRIKIKAKKDTFLKDYLVDSTKLLEYDNTTLTPISKGTEVLILESGIYSVGQNYQVQFTALSAFWIYEPDWEFSKPVVTEEVDPKTLAMHGVLNGESEEKEDAEGSGDDPGIPNIQATHDTFLKLTTEPSSHPSNSEAHKILAGDYLVDIKKLEPASPGHHVRATTDDNKSAYLWLPHWSVPDELKLDLQKKAHAPVAQQTAKTVKSFNDATNISQPDASTCQAACVAMALETNNVYGIRQALTSMGTAGDPAVMANYMRPRLNGRYSYNGAASLNDLREKLLKGYFVIIHGMFTSSGHVIGLDGIHWNPVGDKIKFDVADPWSEFDASSWTYNKPSVKFYDGYYSALLIYSACVVAFSLHQGIDTYKKGQIDINRKGAYAHFIAPPA